MPPKKFKLNLRGRVWSITLNNPPPTVLEDIEALMRDALDEGTITYFVGQVEVGEKEGTEHLQAAIRFKERVSFTRVKWNFPYLVDSHIERARHASKLFTYCKKKATRKAGPVEVGTPPMQGHRTDVDLVVRLISKGKTNKDLLTLMPSAFDRFPRLLLAGRAVYFEEAAKDLQLRFNEDEGLKKYVRTLYGPPRTGKTSHVMLTEKLDDIFELRLDTGSSRSVWFDGYRGQSILLIDDYMSQMDATLFLRLLDTYAVQVQVKGGSVWVNFEKVYVTTNRDPRELHDKAKPEIYAAVQSRLSFQSRSIDAKLMRFPRGVLWESRVDPQFSRLRL